MYIRSKRAGQLNLSHPNSLESEERYERRDNLLALQVSFPPLEWWF